MLQTSRSRPMNLLRSETDREGSTLEIAKVFSGFAPNSITVNDVTKEL